MLSGEPQVDFRLQVNYRTIVIKPFFFNESGPVFDGFNPTIK